MFTGSQKKDNQMKRLLFSVMVLTGLTAMQASAAPKGSSMDTDKDGKVSKQEFCAFSAKIAEKKGTEFNAAGAEKQFKAKDKNGDGFLTGEELVAAPKAPKAPKVEDKESPNEGSEE